MDVLKQENYALLHDESDLEEYDKDNVSKVKSHRKSHLRRFINNMTRTQPQWVCLTTFIVVLVLSQVALCIFVLTEHMDAETSKLEQVALWNNTFGISSHLYNIDNGSSLIFENETQMNDDLKMEQLQPDYHNNLFKRVHTLEINMKSMKKLVSRQGEDIKALLAHQQADGIKYEKALERQFNNKTSALNSLQNRLEEGLDIVFSQISQLRDDVYFIENDLNQTKQERLGENETAMKPTNSAITFQPVPEPQYTTPQTTFALKGEALEENIQTEIIQKIETTLQPVSKQKNEPGELYHISMSFLKTRTDFQVFFYGADKNADGYLTFDEIKNILGEEALSEEFLQHFDDDQNRMYSYTELMRIFFLKD